MAQPTYDLAVQGIAAFTRLAQVLPQRKIARDPLSGVVDGTNKVFYTNFFPILTSGSLSVFTTSGSQVGGVADYDTGEITLTNAPTDQPLATYTFTPYNATQVLRFVMTGFDEMELRWSRGYKLVDASGNAASESSANLYVADKTGQEPVIADSIFAQRVVQVAFMMACVEYRYHLSVLGDAAPGDYMFRETIRGLTVDKTKRSQNIDLLLNRLEERVMYGMKRAQLDFYPTGEHLGGYIASPVTLDYAFNFEWQTAAKDQDNRSQLGFHISYRPIMSYL